MNPVHSINDHLTEEHIAMLADRSEAAKRAKIEKIIAHLEEDSKDPEVIYASGIGAYFLRDYEKCMEIEESVYSYFDDEMGIATIFWHTLAAWRCGKRPVLLEDKYHGAMLVGHHKSYNRIMALATGVLSLDNAMLMFNCEFRPLEHSIFGYGLYCYLQHIGENDKAAEVLDKVYNNQEFWITYAYLAAWNDKECGGKYSA